MGGLSGGGAPKVNSKPLDPAALENMIGTALAQSRFWMVQSRLQSVSARILSKRVIFRVYLILTEQLLGRGLTSILDLLPFFIFFILLVSSTLPETRYNNQGGVYLFPFLGVVFFRSWAIRNLLVVPCLTH